jgi:endonuclease I
MKNNIQYVWIILLIISCGGGDDDNLTPINHSPNKFLIEVTTLKNTEAIIDWEDALDIDGDVVTYTIQQGSSKIENLSETSYSFTNLLKNTNYKGSITASDGNGGETSVSYSYTTTNESTGNVGSFSIPTNLINYYKDIDLAKTGTNLYNDLATLTISKHTKFLEYSERHNYLYDADEDINNKDNVILIYSGESRFWKEYAGNHFGVSETFNTEHIYPQSLIATTAVTDLHHLRACDSGINSSRGNHPFTDGSGSYKYQNSTFYPGDEWKGDVARMIMYVNLRYNEPWNDISTEGINLFIRWNAEDPVSSIEIQRNNIIEGAQGNRNPFIDNPYLATIIWGGDSAANLWKK